MLSLQQPLIPCECGSVAGQSCPVRHITLWSSPLVVLGVKNTARNKNRTAAAAQRVLLSLPSRSIAFPSSETEKSWGGGERLCPRGMEGGVPSPPGCTQPRTATFLSPATLTYTVPCHLLLSAAACLLRQLVRSLVQAFETAPFLRRSSDRNAGCYWAFSPECFSLSKAGPARNCSCCGAPQCRHWRLNSWTIRATP